MAKVITYSQVFPSYHKRAGESTYFVEQIVNSFISIGHLINDIDSIENYDPSITDSKNHTIRSGHRFKVGDWFSPRVWSGRAYKSRQIILAPDIQIPKIWNIEIDECGVWSIGKPGEQLYYIDEEQSFEIAKNDGLSEMDLLCWFNKTPFHGQIICWNPKIEY